MTEPVIWKSGDVITAEKLNKTSALIVYTDANVDSNLINLTYQEVYDVMNAEIPVIMYVYWGNIDDQGAVGYIIYCGEGDGFYLPHYYIISSNIFSNDESIYGAESPTDNLMRWNGGIQ